ncbi:MAG: hypothetical protein ACJA1C_000249 [Crocinitomicaceae bacterium]|jgi:hypothetical protein
MNMKSICLAFSLFAFIGSSYGQITSIHIQSIESGAYNGTVNPADFLTHNFSGETIQINSNGQSSLTVHLLFNNLTQNQQDWIISRQRLNLNPSGWEYIQFGVTTDVFGGVGADLSTSPDLWIAPPNFEQTVEFDEVLGLSVFLSPSSTSGCGTYRYYLGTTLDPFQDSVDLEICYTLVINDLSEIEANIYPNPSSSQLNVEADLMDASIAIADLSGRTLLAEQFNNEMNLNVAELKDGVYFVIIEKKGISTIKEKIIVQH